MKKVCDLGVYSDEAMRYIHICYNAIINYLNKRISDAPGYYHYYLDFAFFRSPNGEWGLWQTNSGVRIMQERLSIDKASIGKMIRRFVKKSLNESCKDCIENPNAWSSLISPNSGWFLHTPISMYSVGYSKQMQDASHDVTKIKEWHKEALGRALKLADWMIDGVIDEETTEIIGSPFDPIKTAVIGSIIDEGNALLQKWNDLEEDHWHFFYTEEDKSENPKYLALIAKQKRLIERMKKTGEKLKAQVGFDFSRIIEDFERTLDYRSKKKWKENY